MEGELIVLIAHYNNLKGLEASLRSIKEPFNVDVLVVDDGSKEKPDETFLKQVYKNGRLFFEFLKRNSGVGVAANHGLATIEKMDYEFIGRLDCGDLCLENKFAKQLKYLKLDPELKLLGTWANYVTEQGEFLFVLKHPTSYEEIKKKMYLNSMFVNPSVVFRAEILKEVGNYPYEYRHASQDYAFFFKVVKKFKAENYPEALLDYVIEEKSISTKKRHLQVKNRLKIIQDNFYWGFYPLLGLLRNFALLFASRKMTTRIKRIFKK